MVNEILENWDKITWKWLNTKNEDLTETLDEQRFREYVLKNLIEKHVRVEYGVEKFWYQWKILRIDLPAWWDFWWYKFECFISDKALEESSYGKKYENYSYSHDEIKNFNEEIWKYMKSLWIKRYWYHDFSDIFYNLVWKYRLFDERSAFWLKDNVWYLDGTHNNKSKQRSKNGPYQYSWRLLLKLS